MRHRIKKYDFVLLRFETREGIDEKRFENCSVGKAVRTLVSDIKMPVILHKVNTSESHLHVAVQKVKNRCNSYEGLVDGKPGVRQPGESDGWERRDAFFAEEKRNYLNSN